MLEKVTDYLNEMTGLGEKVCIIIDSINPEKEIYILNRETRAVIKRGLQIEMFDERLNFTPLFKKFVLRNFNTMENFLKNLMYVNNFDDAILKLKKEKNYLEFEGSADSKQPVK